MVRENFSIVEEYKTVTLTTWDPSMVFNGDTLVQNIRTCTHIIQGRG